jgi:hypothetical protein
MNASPTIYRFADLASRRARTCKYVRVGQNYDNYSLWPCSSVAQSRSGSVPINRRGLRWTG